MRISITRLAPLMLVILGACTAQGVAPQPSPTGGAVSSAPSPTPVTEWASFASDRYGYSIEHPADWVVRQVPGSPYLEGVRVGSPGTDLLIPPDSARFGTDDGVVAVMAHELLDGETLEAFTERFSRAAACNSLGRPKDPVTLGGEIAEVRSFSCGGHNWLQLTALSAGRGYVLWAVGTTTPHPANRPVNEAIIGSFAFTAPEAAAWSSFTSERYGYAIDHPAEMEVLEAEGIVELPGLRPRKPGTDTISTPRSHESNGLHHVVTIAVRDLEPEETLAALTARANLATTCRPLDPATTDLDGEPAEFRRFDCGSVHWRQITAIHDGRAYVVWLSSVLPLGQDTDSPLDAMLESFRFSERVED